MLPEKINIFGCLSIALILGLALPGRGQSVLPPPPQRPAEKKNLLERDPRLQQKVTLESRKETLGKVLRLLSRDTKVDLTIYKGNGMAPNPVSASFRDTPLKDVMDAIAAIQEASWEQTGERGYVLQASIRHHKLFLPENELERTEFRLGNEFVANTKDLSPKVQAALQAEPGDGQAHVSDLPPAMQNTVRQMMENHALIAGAAGFSLPVSLEEVPTATIRLDKTMHREGFTRFALVIGGRHGGGVHMYFSNLEQALRAKQAKRAHIPKYDPREAAGGREEAIKELLTRNEKLQQAALEVPEAPLAAALRALAARTGISFLSWGEQVLTETRNVSLGPMPIDKLLDKLLALYNQNGLKWECRKSGVIIVR